MSHYLVLLNLEFFPDRLATLPYGLDSNITQLLANMLTKSSVFYYLPFVSCNLVSIKIIIIVIIINSWPLYFEVSELLTLLNKVNVIK